MLATTPREHHWRQLITHIEKSSTQGASLTSIMTGARISERDTMLLVIFFGYFLSFLIGYGIESSLSIALQSGLASAAFSAWGFFALNAMMLALAMSILQIFGVIVLRKVNRIVAFFTLMFLWQALLLTMTTAFLFPDSWAAPGLLFFLTIILGHFLVSAYVVGNILGTIGCS